MLLLKSLFKCNQQVKAIIKQGLSLSLGLFLIVMSVAAYAGYQVGYVFTRGLVLTDNENPIWVTYDSNGKVVSELGEATGSLDSRSWWVLSGEQHRAFEDVYSALETQYPNLEFPMSKATYNATPFTDINGNEIPRPPLFNSTTYVSVLPQSNRLLPLPEQLILAQYTINPAQSVADDVASMLVNKEGVTKLQSTLRIGFKTNMVAENESTDFTRNFGDEIHGPVPDVLIEGMMGSKGSSGADGSFHINWHSIPCPLFGYTIDGLVTATLYSRRFNPGASGPRRYYIQRYTSESCTSNAYIVPFIGPMALGVGFHQTIPSVVDFPLDVMVLSGTGSIWNTPITATTEYSTTDTVLDWQLASVDADIDKDGTGDTVKVGSFEYDQASETQTFVEAAAPADGNYAGLVQGVYLSSLQTDPATQNPDFTVKIAQQNNLGHEGLLSGIALNDLKNTDLYVFRVADNKLISERIGLSQPEVGYPEIGVDATEGKFFYRMEMSGERGNFLRFGLRSIDDSVGYFSGSDFDKYQAKSGMNPELYQQEADHLRPGDRVRIIAINRATGYMGSTETIMSSAGSVGLGADLSWPIGTITMVPPNLKIWVERKFDVISSLASGELTKEQIIGYEGAGLTSDILLSVHTEWLDYDGTPLPETLDDAGFTGRVANLIFDKTLGGSGSVHQFDIKPGKHLQVLQFPQGKLSAQHFYIQVSGEPSHGTPIFSNNNRVVGPDFSSGNHTGTLAGRPNRYTPFLVPIHDENVSTALLSLYKQTLINDPASTMQKPEPYYQWKYRPEMQFSLYDLEVKELKLETNYGEQTTLDVVYDLNTSPYDPLTSFQSERELILDASAEALGGEQIAEVNTYGDSTAQFENLELLQYYNGGELLSLQLASRNDVFNPLYEYTGLPLLLGQATPVSLSRNQSLGAFNPDVNNNGIGDVTDTYAVPGFHLTQDAHVRLDLLDADKQLVSNIALDENDLNKGNSYNFIVNYADIAPHINPQAGVDFYLQVHAKAHDNPLEHKIIMPGNLQQSVSSEMLGQVIEHDTLIQRGSISLSKQDLKLQGLGPDLSFIRSYSNESRKEVGNKHMGPGWSHNHNIFLQVMAKGDLNPLVDYNLPAWTEPLRDPTSPRFVLNSQLPTDGINFDRLVSVSNGGMFKLDGGIWHAQRGRHGRLNFVAAVYDGATLVSAPHYEYTSKDGTRYVFGDVSFATGKAYVQSVIDTNGHNLTYSYEEDTLGELTILGSKRVKTITDSVNRSLTFNYLAQPSGKTRLDNLVCGNCSTTSQNDITLSFAYDDFNVAPDAYFHENSSVLTSVTRDVQTESYHYEFNTVADNVVNLKTITDPNGEITEYFYVPPATTFIDQLKFYAKGLSKYDAVEEIKYPKTTRRAKIDYTVTAANQRVVTDLNGNTKTYTFNTFGNPSQIDSSLGHTAKMTWTIDQGLSDNVVTSRTDEFGNVTSYQYDAQGNVTLETDPYLNTVVQEWYPDFSILKSRTDKNGNVFRQDIDPLTGNVTDEYQSATVNGLVTETHRHHTYNALGQRDSTTDARGNVTEYGYDTLGLLNKVTEIFPTGNLITNYTNDGRGRRINKTDPRGKLTEYEYDDLDRLTLTTDPEGNTTVVGYDDKGNKTSEIITDTYNVDGVINTRVTTLTYFYEDGRDRVTKVTRVAGLSGSATDSAGGEKIFTYDDNGNLETETDWKGVVTTHTYDELNRRRTTKNRTQVDTMSYDYRFVPNLGLEKTITDYEGRVSVEHYDKLNRLTRVDLPTVTNYDGTVNTYYTSYAYDNSNHVLNSRDANGNVTTFEYDGRYLKTRQINALTGEFVWQYDANGNLTKTIDEETRETIYGYDELNRLTSKAEPENHNWVYGYDNSGNQNSVTDPWGYVTTTVYDGVNQPVSITTPDGLETVAFTRDGQKVFHRDTELRTTTNIVGVDSRLKVQIDGVGRTSTFSYDDNNNLTDTVSSWSGAISGATTTATHNTFDALDRLETKTEALGSAVARTIDYDYDKVGNVKVETRPDLRITRFDYDALNRQIRITDADTKAIQQKYDGVGNLLETLNRRGHLTSTTYDVLNRADIMTDARLQIMDYDYDGVGNLTAETDKRGTKTTHVYDDLNRLESSSKPKVLPGADIRLVFNEYDVGGLNSQNRQDRITDANNNVITSTLNWRGQPLRVDYPAGQGYLASYSASVYDNSGFKTSDTDENFNTTNYTYYDDGSVNTIANALLETTTFEYDLFGNQAKVTRPKTTSTTSYAYDELNRLKEITNAENQLTTYEYDSNDNLTHQYTPDSGSGVRSHVEYTYDVLNRRDGHIQHKSPVNLSVSYGYDEEGNKTSITDAKTQVFTNVYDELNRLEQKIYPAGSDINSIVTTYDANNNIDVVTENKTTGIEITDHDYDLLDRLTQTVQRGHTVAYDYDDNGNRTLVSSPRGSTTYSFDGRNRLATAYPTATPLEVTTYNYQANGWKTDITKANGTSSNYTYDVVGRTDVVTHTAADASVISSFDYDYDTNGNRDKQTEIQNGFAANKQQITDYVYDTLDRMQSYTITDTDTGNTTATVYTFHPSYDRATEVVTETVAAVPTVLENRSYTYDETNWLKTITDNQSTNTIDYVYDDNGNTKTKVDNTQATPEYLSFTYNSRDQLVETIRGPPGSEASQGTYAYNYKGMRIRHLGSERGDIEYIYDDQAIIDEVQNNTNTLVAHYRYADKLISLTTPADTQFYHFAALGTTANLSDGAGTNQTAYRVDPYGEITHQEGSSVNRQVFTGQEHDENTGLIYFGARYYDPDSARFLTQDSYLGEFGVAPSLHRYLYAYGNPTVWVDLFGYDNTRAQPNLFAEWMFGDSLTNMRRSGHRQNLEEIKQVRRVNKKMLATTAVAVGTLPVAIPVVAKTGGVAVATGRTVVQGGRAVVSEVSKLGLKNAVLANPIVATEATVTTAAVATGAEVGTVSQSRKVVSKVTETVSDAASRALSKTKPAVTSESRELTVGARVSLKINKDNFTEQELKTLQAAMNQTNIRIASKAESAEVGNKVPFSSFKSRRFVRNQLFPEKPINKVKVKDAETALNVDHKINVDEIVPRQIGGQQIDENQRFMSERLNKGLGPIQEKALKKLPEGTQVQGFDLDIQ